MDLFLTLCTSAQKRGLFINFLLENHRNLGVPLILNSFLFLLIRHFIRLQRLDLLDVLRSVIGLDLVSEAQHGRDSIWLLNYHSISAVSVVVFLLREPLAARLNRLPLEYVLDRQLATCIVTIVKVDLMNHGVLLIE